VSLSRSTGNFKLVRARRDAVPSTLRRGYRRLRPVVRRIPARAVVLGAVTVVLLGALTWVVYGTSVLGVRQVEVIGTSIVDADAVRSVAAVTLGTPLARVDTGAVAGRVGQLAAVAAVDVSRSWPGTLVIDVTERMPAATVAMADGFVVLDAGGVVFQTVPKQPAGLVLLKVTTPGPADPATRAGLAVLAALTPTLRAQVVAVSVPSTTGIRLELAAGRTVIWGSAEQNDVKAQVATVLLARPGKTIDVSAPEVATITP
jgi:cell division protein FtsQ